MLLQPFTLGPRMTSSIESATAADLEALADLLAELFALENDFQSERDKQLRGLRLILDNPQIGRLFVLRLDDGIAGMANALITISTAEGCPVLLLVSAPVSQSEEINVERILQPAPSEIEWKGRPGVIGWKKQLAPNETWKIEVGYTITYPKEGSVAGLP